SAVGGLPIAHDKISYVQIGMLGPFEVRMDDGTFAEVPGARSRGLLIALALEPGHVVPNATLVDWIWGERPPADAANALQRLVSRLRKALPDGAVEGQPGGYRVAVAPDAGAAVAGGPGFAARARHGGRGPAGQRGLRRGGGPPRGAAPDGHGGPVR